MGRLALIGGNSILGSSYGEDAAPIEVDGVTVLDAGTHLLLQRHGADTYTLPHEIDHVANLRALARLGCDRILALGSVGGLREQTPVGTFMAPDDFIQLGPSPSIHDDYRAHKVAGFDPDWRTDVVDVWSSSATTPLVDGGVYWQSAGPRFETPAEIRMFAERAHVVGMTVASECIVAGELGIAHAAICVVDNMANGAGAEPLTLADFETGKEANQQRLLEGLEAVIPLLGEAAA